MTTTLTQLETELAALKQDAIKAIASADSLEQLEQLRVSYLGKKRATICGFAGHG